MNPLLKKSLIASSVALALGAPGAQASLVQNVYGPYIWSTGSANFTMLGANGGTVGGTNDVSMVWDGNAYSSSSDYIGPGGPANVTASSTQPFFGHTWTAHDIQVFIPGTYSFNTALGGGNPESGTLTATVGSGQLGMHMLFNWNGNNNIDVFVVANPSSVFGSGIGRSLAGTTTSGANKCDVAVTKNCLWDGAKLGPDGKPAGSKVWMMASSDGNGDGVMGIPMAAGGPFAGFNANFNATLTPQPKPIPVPAAVWLFGSGLLGLVGIARRKKKA